MRAIVLDKSTLQACRADELERFSGKYRIVLPSAVLLEIFSEDPSKPGAPDWSSYFRKLKNCRFVVTRYLGHFFDEEERTCRPAGNIDDYRQTRGLKQQLSVPFEQWHTPEEVYPRKLYDAETRVLVDHRRRRLASIIGSSEFVRAAGAVPEVARSAGKSLAWAWYQATRPVVFRAWKEYHSRLPLLATRKSFYFMEVWLNNYYDFRRSCEGPGSCRDVSDKVLINETMDIDYLLNLIVKDGIVSGDELMRETALAFFPGRLVFADLKQAMDWRG
jgi:hypothetical protein